MGCSLSVVVYLGRMENALIMKVSRGRVRMLESLGMLHIVIVSSMMSLYNAFRFKAEKGATWNAYRYMGR